MGIRRLFGYAARIGLIATNPCDLLVRRERPKSGKAKRRYLTTEEIRALLNSATSDGAIVVALLRFSGLRAAEALELTWNEIDLAEQVIRVRDQMSRKGKRVLVKTDAGRRDVILMDELAQELRRRRLAAQFSRDDDLVLGNGVGKTLGYTRMLRAFSEAAEPPSDLSSGLWDETESPHERAAHARSGRWRARCSRPRRFICLPPACLLGPG